MKNPINNISVGTGDPGSSRQDTSLDVTEYIFLMQEWRGNQLSEADSMPSSLDLKIGEATAAFTLSVAGFIACDFKCRGK